MTDRPILFSGPMVRALHDDRKTQTRRIIKPRGRVSLFDGFWTDSYVLDPGNIGWREQAYPYRVGDRLWVRETWRVNSWASDVATFFYRAHEHNSYTEMCEQFPVAGRAYIAPTPGKWRPAIHMPRWASRTTLTVTDVRVQRVQEIHDRAARNDCTDEGVFHSGIELPSDWQERGFRSIEKCAYRDLWDSLNAKRGYGWDANPWVVALTFTVQRGNIDQVAP